MKREDIAKEIRPALGALGELPGGTARLGRGDRSGIIVKDATTRQVYYYSDGQPTAYAPLALNINIASINNPAFEGYRIRLGFPNYRPDVLHILGVDAVEGLSAGNGLTPDEQYLARAHFTDVGSLLNFRLAAHDPVDTNVHVDAGYYYDASGLLQFFGGDDFDLSSTISALTSGQHQMAVIVQNESTGDLGVVINTATAGGVNDKDEFNEATVVDMTYGTNDQAKGAVHLYYGQTAISEADIYRRADPRVLFTRPGAGGGGVASGDLSPLVLSGWTR